MAKNPKEETNTEFVNRIMEFSPVGAMMQMFVITALDKYSEQVLLQKDEMMKSMSHGIIDGAAWVRTARVLQKELAEKYGREETPSNLS